MAFSVEQIFLTDHTGKLLPERAAAHHLVEAETLDDALAAFLRRHDASVLGTVQRFPSGQAVATAQQDQTVFTVHVVAGEDVFERDTAALRCGAPASSPAVPAASRAAARVGGRIT